MDAPPRPRPRARVDSTGEIPGSDAWGVGLLGSFRLHVDGATVQVPRTVERLVAAVALHGRRMPRRGLATLLWPEATVNKATACLRTALWQCRRCCPTVVTPGTRAVGLADDVSVDIEARRLRADDLVRLPDGAAATRLMLASGLNELLPGWYDEWVTSRREELAHEWRQTCLRLATALLDAGEPAGALAVGLAVARLDPFHEEAHELIIRAHLAQYNTVEAIRHYDSCRDLLRRGLGMEPGPAISRLVRALTAHRTGRCAGARKGSAAFKANVTTPYGGSLSLRETAKSEHASGPEEVRTGADGHPRS